MSKLEKRTNYLLVIGIDKYLDDSYKDLNNSVYDCNEIINELINSYNFQLAEDPIYNEQATRRNILDKLTSLQYSILEEDNLIIYYAGHGQINPTTNKGSWIPYDASDSSSDYIQNTLIKDAIEDINAKHIFLISDSCFSGTFLTNLRGVDEAIYYDRIDSKKSRWYLASGGTEKVSDGKKGEGSPFSQSLVKCLKDNSNKYLSVSEIINDVVKRTSNNSYQQPIGGEITHVGHEYGQMVFVKTSKSDDSLELEEPLNEERFNILMRTYGYYVGQQRALEVIEKNYPALKTMVFVAKTEWSLAFGSSIDNIITKIKTILKDKWDQYNSSLIGHLNEYASIEITLDEALVFIQEVSSRAKGNIISPIIEILLAYKPEFIENPILEFTKNYRRKLSSKDYSKSKGLDFELEIPLSWSVSDGKRPNVLWLVSNQLKGIMSLCIVRVNQPLRDLNIPEEEWTQETVKEIADLQLDCDNILKNLTTDKAIYKTCKRVIIDGCHALVIEFEDETIRAGFKMKFYRKSFFIIYRDYNLIIEFHLDKNQKNIYKNKEIYSSLFDLITNSIIIFNNYK